MLKTLNWGSWIALNRVKEVKVGVELPLSTSQRLFFSTAQTMGVRPSTTFDQIADFKGYIDKTILINKIAGEPGKKSTFITFPPGWGKTTALSMLETFFRIDLNLSGKRLYPSSKGLSEDLTKLEKLKISGNSAEIKELQSRIQEKQVGSALKKKCKKCFEGKQISKHQNSQWLFENCQGEHPVIKIKIRSLKYCLSLNSVKDSIKISISQTFANHAYLQDLMKNGQKMAYDKFKRIRQYHSLTLDQRLDKTSPRVFADDDIEDSIYFLARLLAKYIGEKPIILIDDFDEPFLEVYGKQFQKDINDLLWGMYVYFIKTFSEHNFKVVAMGVIPITMARRIDDVSQLISLSHNEPHAYFGFTKDEVRKLIRLTFRQEEESRKEQALQILDKCYGGYFVANQDILIPSKISNAIMQSLQKKSNLNQWLKEIENPYPKKSKMIQSARNQEVDNIFKLFRDNLAHI